MAGVLLLFAASMSLVIDILEKKSVPQEAKETSNTAAEK